MVWTGIPCASAARCILVLNSLLFSPSPDSRLELRFYADCDPAAEVLFLSSTFDVCIKKHVSINDIARHPPPGKVMFSRAFHHFRISFQQTGRPAGFSANDCFSAAPCRFFQQGQILIVSENRTNESGSIRPAGRYGRLPWRYRCLTLRNRFSPNRPAPG